MQKKIVVTGVEGFLGSYIARTHDPEKYFLQGTYFDKNTLMSDINLPLRYLDITDKKEVFNILNEMNPDIIIHTAGNSSTDISESNPEQCYRSTVGGTKNIAEWCNMYQRQLVYCSTNAIFSGDEAPYSELSLPYPINRYGMHKYIAESIASTVKSYLIFRLILMYGWNYKTRINPVTFVINSLKEGKSIKMVENSSYVNPIFVESCCNGIWKGIALEKDREVYHLAGRDRCDRYNLALTVAEVFSLDKSLISPVPDEYFSSLAKRPFDSSFITCKAEKELDFIPLSLKEGLSLMKKQDDKLNKIQKVI